MLIIYVNLVILSSKYSRFFLISTAKNIVKFLTISKIFINSNYNCDAQRWMLSVIYVTYKSKV